MPTDAGLLYSRDWAGRPKAMPEGDYALWLRYRGQLPADVTGLHFDVLLGQPRRVDVPVAGELLSMWEHLTRRRADVVGVSASRTYLIELHAGSPMQALGRLIAYIHLLREDDPWGRPVTPVLVSDTEDPNVRTVAEQVGVEYVVL